MKSKDDMPIVAHRAVMAGLGAAAALALWALGDNWDDPAMSPALYLALFTFVACFASVALALAGPVPVGRALKGALGPAVVLTLLVSLAGLRHVVATDLLDDPVMLAVAAVLVVFSTPFLMVWLQDRRGWADYARLFDAAWTMTVRYAVAWAFVAVFWLVAFLGDALLDLVDVGVIDRLMRSDWARFTVSGGILGLGLAVVYELRDTVSPYLFLRLLRLLVPVVLVVVAVFLGAIPLRGLTGLFGDFSAAAILMGAAVVAVTLISTALDRDDRRAVATGGLRVATRALAVLLPLLAALAVWAVLLRVRQYGWTPDRVLAMAVALFLLTYGAFYSVSVLRGGAWMRRIRQVNVIMALAVVAVSALWMTPVLDVYRIAANSQLARFQSGHGTLDQLALWQLAHEWGRSGQAALDQLEAMTGHPEYRELVSRIADAREGANAYQFGLAVQQRKMPDKAAELVRLLPVRPRGAEVHPDLFSDASAFQLNHWLDACNRQLSDGRPACVLVQGAFSPGVAPEQQGMLLYLDANGNIWANHLRLMSDAELFVRQAFDPINISWPALPEKVIQQALDGDFEVRPSGINALVIDNTVLAPGP